MQNWRNDTMNYFQKLINKIKKIKYSWHDYVQFKNKISGQTDEFLAKYHQLEQENKDFKQKILLKQLVDRETVSEFIIDVNLYERLNERITSELYNQGSLNIEEYTIITKQFLSELDDQQYQNIKKRGILV